MEKYIDIHSHILPGMDDGARDLETGIRMLRIAADDGISQIILTPHNKPGHHTVSPFQMAAKVEELRSCLRKEGIEMKLYIGNELYYRSGLIQEIEDGRAYTLAGSHYVLVEFSPLEDYDYIRNGIYALLTGGYYPILAHAERYRNVCTRKSGITDLVEMGCHIQVNAGSVMGKCGLGAKQLTRKLLKQHLLHFIATDAHDFGKRAPHLAGCAAYVRKKSGEAYGRELFYDNPMHVVLDETITN